MVAENRRIWMIGGVALAVLVVVLGGYLLFRGGPESKLTVRSIPSDLTLTLDGRPINANGEVKVKEGQHTLTGQREGFQSYTQTIRAVDGNPLTVKMYLYSNGPAGRAWEKDHPDQVLEAEAEAGRQYDETNKRLNQKYPMLQELPYIGPGFKVDYGVSKVDPDNPEQIGIYIKIFSAEGKTKALEWMRGHGYDPAKYEVIYTTG
jgi:hypothetical protein